MIVTELPPVVLPDQSSHVPGTLHVSRIINDMIKRLDPARYDKHDKTGKPIPMDMQKVQTGANFEQKLEALLKKETLPGLFRPDPVKYDGIWMSPDGLVPGFTLLGAIADQATIGAPCPDPATLIALANTLVVVEYKLTWYSTSKPCPDHEVYLPWIWQIKAYCKGMDTRFGLLIPQFINGNYKPPSPVPPKRYLLEWTPREIDENWAMIVQHAKSMGWL